MNEDLNNWTDMPCSWVRRVNVLKMSALPEFICRFNTIQTQTLSACFVDIDKLTLQFLWKCERLGMAELKKKGSWQGSTLGFQDVL